LGYHADEKERRKVGRPFKGQVEEFTKEPNVPERRSILRGFKKFYSKREFEDIRKISGRPSSTRLLDSGQDGSRLVYSN
jgi:hypothetical protein